MASLRSIKGQRMSFIIIWKVAGKLHSPKNMMSGSKSPQFMERATFHSLPSFSQTLLKPQWRSKVVNHSTSRSLVSTSETNGSGWEFFTMISFNQLPVVLYQVEGAFLLLDE